MVDYMTIQKLNILILNKSHSYMQTTWRFQSNRNNHLRGKACPKCRNKSEGRIAEYLFNSNITYREYLIGDRRYDFFLPAYNLLIERDGEQHYREVSLFSGKYRLFKSTKEK